MRVTWQLVGPSFIQVSLYFYHYIHALFMLSMIFHEKTTNIFEIFALSKTGVSQELKIFVVEKARGYQEYNRYLYVHDICGSSD